MMKILIVKDRVSLYALLATMAALAGERGVGDAKSRDFDPEYVGECTGGDRRLLAPCCCATCSARNQA